MERVAGIVLSLLRYIYRFLSRRAKISLQYIFSLLRIHAKLGSSKSPPTIFDGAHGTARNPGRIDISGPISPTPYHAAYKGVPTAAGIPNMDTLLTAPIGGGDPQSLTPISTHCAVSVTPTHQYQYQYTDSAEAGLRSSCNEDHPLAASPTQDCGGNDQSSTSNDDALQHLNQHGSASSANVNSATVLASFCDNQPVSEDPVPPTPPIVRSDQGIVGATSIAPNVFPLFPSDNMRYSHNNPDRLISREDAGTFKIRRDMDWSDDKLPAGWEKIISEDGYPYFRHAEHRVVTDNNLYHEETSALIVKFVEDIQEARGTNCLSTQADEVYLVLQLSRLDTGQTACGYYYADYQQLTVFWHEEEFDITYKLQGICGQPSKSLIKLLLESEFWTHWALYANIVMPTSSTMLYVESCIRKAQTDVLSSNTSTINFGHDDLSKRMDILLQAKEGIVGTDWSETPVNERPTTWFIGRFMAALVFDRYVNYYGQYHVRLNRKRSVFKDGTTLTKTLFFRVMVPLLFCAPDTVYERRELWTDRSTYCVAWKKYLQALYEESKHQMIYSSLLLSSNIAFLAIPTVTSENDTFAGKWVQIPSYVSTVFSIASIMIGLLLSRQHQIHDLSHAGNLGTWFKRRYHGKVGLEPLAFMYNLSYVLFMWGMSTFLAAFTIMCFETTTLVARIFSSLALAVFGGLVITYYKVCRPIIDWSPINRISGRVKYPLFVRGDRTLIGRNLSDHPY